MDFRLLLIILSVCLFNIVHANSERTVIEGFLKNIELKSHKMHLTDGIVNQRPIIGIVTQYYENIKPYTSYIMASYVKFLESGGARVVPIRYNDTDAQTLDILGSLNGVVLPGGGLDLFDNEGKYTEYTRKGKVIMDFIKSMNDQGIYYPVLGICLGIEELGAIEAPYAEILGDFDAENVANNLTFIIKPRDSKLFSSISSDLLAEVQEFDITFNAHIHGISRTMFEKHSELSKAYKVLAVSYDRKGVEYIASIEHTKYPIYGLQFHPEKNAFIWKSDLVVPHSRSAIKLTQYIAGFFVAESRKNNNHFLDDATEVSFLIENNPVSFTNTASQDIYMF